MIQCNTSELEYGVFDLIINHYEAIPVIGLPRSGKSTLLKNVIINADDKNINRLLICNDEFDGFENRLADIVTEGLRCDDEHLSNLERLIEFLDAKIVIIDSFKKLIFEGASLRKGGISNQIFDHFNKLHQLATRRNTTIIYSINSGSNDVSFNEEIVSVLLGCSNSIMTVKNRTASIFLRKVDGERAITDEVLANI